MRSCNKAAVSLITYLVGMDVSEFVWACCDKLLGVKPTSRAWGKKFSQSPVIDQSINGSKMNRLLS